MKLLLRTLFAGFISLGCAACAGPSGMARGDITPLENVVIDNKHALTTAGEQLLFEEFVKYKVLGSTFNLYKIKASSIDVSTTEKIDDTNQASASLPFLTTKGVGLTKTIAVSSGNEGKLSVTLEPVAQDPNTYRLVKKAFAHAPEGIFAISTADDQACTKEAYCFTIPNDNNEVAYLKDVRKLRVLENAIRDIAGPKEPAKPDKT